VPADRRSMTTTLSREIGSVPDFADDVLSRILPPPPRFHAPSIPSKLVFVRGRIAQPV